MVPTISSTPAFTPAHNNLIATPLPGTNALRVPHDNVAPSVSIAQVNNNARGNGGAAVTQAQPQQAVLPVVNSAGGALPAMLSSAPAPLSASSQTTVFAQMLGQDSPPGTTLRGIMVEYEKLVSFSSVKYKPSYATLPEPEPSSLFTRLLQQEKAAKPAPIAQEPLQTAARAGQSAQAAANANAPAPRAAAQRGSVSETPAPRAKTSGGNSTAPVQTPRFVASVYAAVATRSNAETIGVEDSV